MAETKETKDYKVSTGKEKDSPRVRRAIVDTSSLAQRQAAVKPLRRKRVEASEGSKANPSLLTFPTDRDGIMRGIRKEVLSASGRICGDKNKLKLFMQTMEILVTHVNERFEEDKMSPGPRSRTGSTEEKVVEAKPVEVTYAEQVKALKEAGVELADKKGDTVTAAYMVLTSTTTEE